MTDWKRLRKHLLENSETRDEYEAVRPQYELASKLIALRQRLDLSQRDLARIAGMKQPQLARIESGAVSPTWDTISKILASVNAELQLKVRAPDGRLVKV